MTPKYTQGSIGGRMIKSAFAMLPGALAISGYNIVDTYFVGQLGTTPLAGMGFTFPIVMLVSCIFHGLGVGVMAPAAQMLGAQKRDKAVQFVSYGILLVVIISSLVGILSFLGNNFILECLDAQGESLKYASGYMNIWYIGILTSALCMVFNDVVISVGSPRTAGLLMMAGLLLNIALDPLLIFGYGPFPAMGIKGAALATVIAQGGAASILFVILYSRYKMIQFVKLPWRVIRVCWGTSVRYSVPAVMGMLLMPIGSFIVTKITAHFGDAAVAAIAAAGRLEMAAFVFPMALGITLMPMIAQNYGAKRYDRIRECHRFANTFAFIFLMVMALIYFLGADFFVSLMAPEPEVQSIMKMCMSIIPWGFCMIEIHRYSGFFYTGCAKPHASVWLNSLRILVLMVPLSYLALYFNSLEGLFWARLIADVGAGGTGFILSYLLVKRLPPEEPVITDVPEEESPSHLNAWGAAQADIDRQSATQ